MKNISIQRSNRGDLEGVQNNIRENIIYKIRSRYSKQKKEEKKFKRKTKSRNRNK